MLRIFRLKIVFKYLFLFTFFLSSCVCRENNEKSQEKRFTFNLCEGDVPGLHPFQLQGPLHGYTIAKLLFEGLTRIGSNGKPELAGALDVEISPCLKHFTFTLRPNYFSDGKRVTAYDYERSWKMALDPTSDCPRAELLYVLKNAYKAKKSEVALDEIGVKALDDNTLYCELESPAPYFLDLVSLPIFSPCHPDTVGYNPTFFNGPFIVDQWKRGDYLSLKANPYFWNKENRKIDEIQILMVTDCLTAIQMFEKKQTDWIGDPLTPIVIECLPSLKKKYAVQEREVVRPFWIFLNTQDPLLSVTRIRQALNLALDRKQISEHIFYSNIPLYQPLPTSFSLNPDKNESYSDYKQLFAEGAKEAGLELPYELVVNYFNHPPLKQFVEYLKETWESVFPIKVTLQGTDWATFFGYMTSGNYQVGGCYISPYYNDPSEPLSRLEFLTPSNFCKWMNEDYQKLLQAARHANSLSVRNEFLRQAEGVLNRELPVIPVINLVHRFICHSNLSGYVINHCGGVDFAYAFF